VSEEKRSERERERERERESRERIERQTLKLATHTLNACK